MVNHYLIIPAYQTNWIIFLLIMELLNTNMMVNFFIGIYIILEPGGILIITTPANWTTGLLKLLAFVRLISNEEILEHVFTYSLPLLGWYFGSDGFQTKKIGFGYHEFYMILWRTTEK
jgi:hypothetical protein